MRRTDTGRRRRLIVDSRALSGTSSADDDDDDDEEAMSSAGSTGLGDVDVALMWHCARCSAVVEVSVYSYYALATKVGGGRH